MGRAVRCAMDAPVIAATNVPPPEVVARLRAVGDVVAWEKPGRPASSEIVALATGAQALLAWPGDPLGAATIERLTGMRVVATIAVGYDNIDVAACTARGIAVGNTPGVLVDAAADLTLGLIINAVRRIPELLGWVRAGQWKENFQVPFFTPDLARKQVGIVGMGGIGGALARRVRACGMPVAYSNRNRRPDEDELGATYMSLDDLLATSDVVVALAPLSAATRHLFNREAFAKMKRSAIFVNVARGGLVDTQALYDALVDGTIAFAALDVIDPEPPPADLPILHLPNVIMSPHAATATQETRLAMAMMAAENIIARLTGKPMPSCVNADGLHLTRSSGVS